MRIAIPTKWGEIGNQFHQCSEITIYDVEIQRLQKKEIVSANIVSQEDFFQFLKEYRIHTIICGSIDSDWKVLLRTMRIELNYGVSGTADAVLIQYLSGERLSR